MSNLVSYKTRFCPSPTGQMHLGNVRTALFSALLAKNKKGEFLLRIEDTDKERSQQRYVELLMQDLRWLGLNWNEGPEHEKNAGPYFQSQRVPIYNDFYQKLEQSGLAYPCFCSEEQLVLLRKIQRSTGKPPRYPGTCRHLTPEQVKSKLAEGLKPTLRFRIPDSTVVEFTDLVHGQQRFQTDDMGDFIIRRTDGTPPFLFCNAIDDALMGVTCVLRGEDHLANTPRQILILQAFNLPIPEYGHIALIMGPDGTPLAKRHGSRSIDELRSSGYLAGAIINYLARLGHYFGHDHFSSFETLAGEFKIENLSKSPAKFNLEQLNFWQKEAVMRMTAEEMWAWLDKTLQAKIPAAMRAEFLEIIKPNILFPQDAYHWVDVLFGGQLEIGDEENIILKKAGADYFKIALNAFEMYGTDLNAITKHLKEVLRLNGAALYQPLRIAITGQKHGPELTRILNLMQRDEIKRRLETAV